ncbi:MAG: hypothetical protein RI842_10630 [Schleiferiaceae bacterium]|nr:hypothetical protein [Schleiferiaceae bacterium]MDR9443162.1 hypothetical protein [Schleiferiaceae bacterium]
MINGLNRGTRLKQGDSLRDFQIRRAAVPLRLGYHFQSIEVFLPFIKIGAYWVASGTATSLAES